MAYLSDVTHKMLVGKHQPALGVPPELQWSPRHHRRPKGLSTPDEAGITLSGEFVGGIRCMEVHRLPGMSIDRLQVWTGEQDGALCVRDGMGHGRFTIEKKKKVFVTALMCHGWDSTPGRFMYAGMSDGYIRVYDQVALADGSGVDYELVCETKKHTAGVTCMLSVRDLIITGGRDWQIFMWRWDGQPGDGGVFRAIDQFWGHQNAVRCLTYDQGPDRLLYSGGDDCSIKCLELETGVARSVPGGFPIEGYQISRHGHRGGIRALVVYEKYLFSASEDGSIRVWDSQDGTFVRTMFRCAPGRETAILCLLKDPAGGRVWSGGADGVIRIFSAYDHVQICQVEDPHNGAMVTGLSTLGRLNGIKGWYVSKDGTCKIIYSESDAPDGNQATAIGPNEEEMAEEITRLRAVTIQDFKDLDKIKEEMTRVDQRATRRKALLLEALKSIVAKTQRGKYFAKLLEWHTKNTNATKRNELAHIMFATNDQLLVTLYLRKLNKYRIKSQRKKQHNFFAESLLSQTTAGLQVMYYRRLADWVRKESRKQHTNDVVACLMKGTAYGQLTIFFFKWQRWVFRKRQVKNRGMISSCLQSCCKAGLMATYYHKLVYFYRQETMASRKAKISDALMLSHATGRRRVYLNKCLSWLQKRKQASRQQRMGNALLRSTAEGTRRVYLSHALRWLRERQETARNEKLEELNTHIDELNRRLATSQQFTDGEISAQTEDVEREISQLEQEMQAVEGRLEDLSKETADLAEELRNVGKRSFDISDSDSATKQSFNVIAYLKCHAVHCDYDHATILNMHKKKEGGADPSTIFVAGMKRVKDAIQAYCSRHDIRCNLNREVWDVPSDIGTRLERKVLDGAHLGIKEMVIASDQAVANPKITREIVAKIDRTGVSQQILHNQTILVDIVSRVYERNMLKELKQLSPQEIEEMGLSDVNFGTLRGSEVANLAKEDVADVSGTSRDVPVPLGLDEEEPAPEPAAPLPSATPRGPPRTTVGCKFSAMLQITEITPGGAADKGGLKVGDVVTAVGSTPVKDKKTYGAAAKHIRSGEPVKFTFKRGVRTRTTSLNP